MQKNLIKVIAGVFVLGGLTWFWLSADSDKSDSRASVQTEEDAVLVSSIQPISDAQLAAQAGKLIGELSAPAANNVVSTEFVRKFSDINAQILDGNRDSAMAALKALIEEQPRFIEPYINLASLYAQSEQLELARKTLMSAIQANQNTAILFNSLQKIHGEQAAIAYNTALEIDTLETKPLILPTIASIAENRLNSAVYQSETPQGSLPGKADTLNSTAHDKRITKLEQANRELEKAAALLEQENAGLVKDNIELVERNNSLEQSKNSLEPGVSNVEPAEVAALQAELEATKRSIDSLTKKYQGELARLQSELAAKTTTDAAVVEVDVDVAKRREQSAIRLVKSWAASWSAQDVNGYIKHYADNYRPSAGGLTNQQWRAQRQVRLTNKDFIEVNVRGFSIDDRGSQFSVTFTQHYRSNTVDDTIRKRLIFTKKSDDWSAARIIAERVVSR